MMSPNNTSKKRNPEVQTPSISRKKLISTGKRIKIEKLLKENRNPVRLTNKERLQL